MPAKATKPVNTLSLPIAPSLWQALGPSFVMLGLALGSGELLLWPYLASQWGLGLLWGALLGISLQYVLNTEVIRYTLVWGESVFVGWRRLTRAIPLWLVISTFIPWAIPGFSSAVADIMLHLIPGLHRPSVAIVTLLLAGLILSTGRVYVTLEKFQTKLILIVVPIIFLVTLIVAAPSDWWSAVMGLFGQGDGWRFFPPNVALLSFLGAFAYAGAGGNLNLTQSTNVLEKGFGMASYATKVHSAFDLAHKHTFTGQTFPLTVANKRRWREWWRLVTREHLIVFWGLGLLSIIFLSVLASASLGESGKQVGSGLNFLFAEATAVANQTLPVFRVFFLITSMILLFSSQLGVLSASARIIAENLLLLFKPIDHPARLTAAFYGSLWCQIGLGIVIILLGFSEPRLLITTAAVLNAAAMMVAFGLILWLNHARLPKPLQPSLWRSVALFFGVITFVYLLFETIKSLV